MACKYILDGKEYSEQEFREYAEKEFLNKPKTRRILELQSDSFQKGRDNPNLVVGITQEQVESMKPRLTEEEYRKYSETAANTTRKNNFLQLLNKDGNWISFFIRAAVQDSSKKGYEKVLFPAGETAAKIEGHETLAAEIKSLDDQINAFKDGWVGPNAQGKFFVNWDRGAGSQEVSSVEEAIEFLEKKKADLKSQGIEKLKPIEGFYEVRVKNTLDKIYGKGNVNRITDDTNYSSWLEELRKKGIIEKVC